MPTSSLNITVQGLNHAINFLAKFDAQLRTEYRSELNRIADQGATRFQRNAHVITGYMKSNIKKTQVTDRSAEITAQAGYSGHENNRGGPHAFWTSSLQDVEKIAIDGMIAATNRVISKKGF